MDYKSPLCSCIKCGVLKSAKGIFSHYFSNHDPEGMVIMANIRNSGTNATFRNAEFIKQNKRQVKIKENYTCNNVGCSNLTSSKYCSKRCSAIANNSKRTSETYKKQAKTLIENKLKSGWGPKEKQYIVKSRTSKKRVCIECEKIDNTFGRFQSNKCSFCNDSLAYRRQCEFKFNLNDYPDEFDFKLLSEHGMFHPKQNPKGVSRDHMLSVQYGKINRIPPNIIAHPANCRLVLQSDNTRKQSNSCITYEELLIRIDAWNFKYSMVAEPGFEPELALDVSRL